MRSRGLLRFAAADSRPAILPSLAGWALPWALAACGGNLAPSDVGQASCAEGGPETALPDAGLGDRFVPPSGEPDGAGAPDGTLPGDAAPPDAATTSDGGAVSDANFPLDGAGCGPCAGTCFGSRCLVVLASNQTGPGSLAVNSTAIYWTNGGSPQTQYSESAVMTVGTGGGTPSTIEATPGGDSDSVAADDRSVVWVVQDDNAQGSIRSASVTDLTAPVTLAANVGAATFAMDSAGIYFGTDTWQDSEESCGVWRIGRDGGAPVLLTGGSGGAMAVLAYDGIVYARAYPDSTGGESIYAVGTDGSDPHTLVSGLGGTLGWAPLGAELYLGWYLEFGQIDELPLAGESDGGAPTTFVENYSANAMTSDGVDLYFTYANTIYELSTDGGAPVALAWKLRAPGSIAVDDQSVYWADELCNDDGGCSGAILKLTPK
jgi:hypothetical protein